MNLLDNQILAIKSSIEAGNAVLEVYNTDFEVDYKDDHSPLTKADLISNQIINDILSLTDIPILSEENKMVEYAVRKEWDTCWIVDPIDGTKEFIKKNGEFTINIALIKGGITKLGVIYVPVTRELYYTDELKTSSYKTVIPEGYFDLSNILFKDQDKIIPKQDDKKSIDVVGSRSHMNDDTLMFVESLKADYENVNIVSKGSSLKFCLVAEGIADVYPRFAPTMEWDTAAGQAICEAAGLKVIDQSTKKTMLYNRENLLNSYFLVTK